MKQKVFMTNKYFNSQPHKEADMVQELSFVEWIISTHSLTRRLTIRNDRRLKTMYISTHSLTRRLTK